MTEVAKHMLAPMQLKPLLEIYCSPDISQCPHLHRLFGSDPCDVVDELTELGLIEHRAKERPVNYNPHGYECTQKGRAYVEMLLQTPMPVQRWIAPS